MSRWSLSGTNPSLERFGVRWSALLFLQRGKLSEIVQKPVTCLKYYVRTLRQEWILTSTTRTRKIAHSLSRSTPNGAVNCQQGVVSSCAGSHNNGYNIKAKQICRDVCDISSFLASFRSVELFWFKRLSVFYGWSKQRLTNINMTTRYMRKTIQSSFCLYTRSYSIKIMLAYESE